MLCSFLLFLQRDLNLSLPGEQILSCMKKKKKKLFPKDTISTFKVKLTFGSVKQDMENCKMSGENHEILKWKISGKPCMGNIKYIFTGCGLDHGESKSDR